MGTTAPMDSGMVNTPGDGIAARCAAVNGASEAP